MKRIQTPIQILDYTGPKLLGGLGGGGEVTKILLKNLFFSATSTVLARKKFSLKSCRRGGGGGVGLLPEKIVCRAKFFRRAKQAHTPPAVIPKFRH